ncbi:TrmH family RNA methyltransferase [Galbibacter sp.]|uniref:TrmH family RNA methyltransferase n=1 Tax=Galbibacter sp. TaxID=2918471 RepID=UPI003A92A2DC
MVSKNELKLITSLHQKKYRNKHQLFIAEGAKGVLELLDSELQPYKIFKTRDIDGLPLDKTVQISAGEMKKLSSLKTPSEVLAVFHMPEEKNEKGEGLILALDDVRDPGNLGTIIRLCDWFGVSQLLCSENTVDCYNPKVVQATMGSLARVQINYVDLENYLGSTDKPIYGAIMEGGNVYDSTLAKDAILVMGNESNGISSSILKKVTNTLSIPRFGSRQTESLNVATATAILLSEFRRS